MKKINILQLLLSFFLISCETLNDTEQSRNIDGWKYSVGDCVRFNPFLIKNTDGTPMKIVGVIDGKYLVKIKHERLDQAVIFTAVRKKFEDDTISIKCLETEK